MYHGWLDGQEVAVKVVHPNLRRQMQLDLMVMRTMARFLFNASEPLNILITRCLTWLFPSTSWLNLCEAIEEFDCLMTNQVIFLCGYKHSTIELPPPDGYG